MESFTHRGVFWLPENPEQDKAGVLSFSPTDGAHLELTGSFSEGLTQLGTYPVIHGMIQGGKAVTLLGGYALGFTWDGLAIERIRASVIVVGAHCRGLNSQRFREITVSTELLQLWSEVTPLESKISFQSNRLVGLDVAYTFPDEIVDKTDGTMYLIRCGFSTSGDQRTSFEIRTQTAVTVRPPRYETLDTLTSEFLVPVQQLVALGTDFPVNLTKCSAALRVWKGEGTRAWELKTVEIFFQSRFIRMHQAGREPLPVEFLFRRGELPGGFGRALSRWQRARAELDSVLGLVFSERFGQGVLLDQKFSYLIQAVETYHRRRVGGDAIPAEEHARRLKVLLGAAPAEYRKWLEERLRYSNEPSLRQRLKGMLDLVPGVQRDLVRRWGAFVQKVLDTRNYFTHHDTRLKDRSAWGEDLYLLTEVLRYCCYGLLMIELGFDRTTVDQQLRRSPRYQDLMRRVRL
jgi:hypothetical protein